MHLFIFNAKMTNASKFEKKPSHKSTSALNIMKRLTLLGYRARQDRVNISLGDQHPQQNMLPIKMQPGTTKHTAYTPVYHF